MIVNDYVATKSIEHLGFEICFPGSWDLPGLNDSCDSAHQPRGPCNEVCNETLSMIDIAMVYTLLLIWSSIMLFPFMEMGETSKPVIILYRVTDHLRDLDFVDIKVGGFGYPTHQQGTYRINPLAGKTFHKSVDKR